MCGGDPATRAAQRASATIPIVALTDDMVGSGLVRSLASPGGNTTGVSILAGQLDGKRQELLMEMVPGLRRMAALVDSNTTAPRQLQELQNSARARGVELSLYQVSRQEEIAPAIDAAKKAGAAALNVLATPLLFSNRRIIFERVTALRLPVWPAHQPDLPGTHGSTGRQGAARAKPVDVPVVQPTTFELVINLHTAKALGLEIPRSTLLRADQLIR